VVRLLADMGKEVDNSMLVQEKTYDKMMCWCSAEQKKLKASVDDKTGTKGELAAGIIFT
jgi:hypothetical protein